MRRCVHLGKPEYMNLGVSGSPRQAGEGGLHLGEPEDCHCGLLWLVCGRFQGSVYDCWGLLRGPLYDLIESFIG